MGNNACCADGSERRSYDPTLKKALDFDPSTSSIISIKFPNAKPPLKNQVVA